jgi:hypothetical protein
MTKSELTAAYNDACARLPWSIKTHFEENSDILDGDGELVLSDVGPAIAELIVEGVNRLAKKEGLK